MEVVRYPQSSGNNHRTHPKGPLKCRLWAHPKICILIGTQAILLVGVGVGVHIIL